MDKELIKLAYQLGYEAGAQKRAQFVQGLRNIRDAFTGARGNSGGGRVIQGIKGVMQTGQGLLRGAGRFGKAVAGGLAQGVRNGMGEIQYGTSALGRAGQQVGQAVQNGAQAVGQVVQDGAQAVGQAAQNGAQAIKHDIRNGAMSTYDKLRNMYQGFRNSTRNLRDQAVRTGIGLLNRGQGLWNRAQRSWASY